LPLLSDTTDERKPVLGTRGRVVVLRPRIMCRIPNDPDGRAPFILAGDGGGPPSKAEEDDGEGAVDAHGAGARALQNTTAAVVAQARGALQHGRSAGFSFIGKATAQEAEAGQMLLQLAAAKASGRAWIYLIVDSEAVAAAITALFAQESVPETD
jgi:hypothetical protein